MWPHQVLVECMGLYGKGLLQQVPCPPYFRLPTARNSDVAVQTGLPNITETIIKRRHMLFGHVAKLDATTPAHQILKQVIAVKSGYQPDAVRQRAPGRPRNSWIMLIGNGSPLSIRREWKKAQDHGHHGESSQRTSAVFAS